MHMSTGDSKKKGLPKVCISVVSMTLLSLPEALGPPHSALKWKGKIYSIS